MSWLYRNAVLYEATNWVARLVWINLSFLTLCLYGGIVLGLFPAWYVTLVAVRSELRGEPMQFAELCKVFRSAFVSANAFGLVTGALVVLGMVETALLLGSAPPALSGLAVGTTFLIFFLTVNTWAALSAMALISLETVRRAVLLTVVHPVRSLGATVVTIAVLTALYFLPALALAMGGALLALAICLVGQTDMAAMDAADKEEG